MIENEYLYRIDWITEFYEGEPKSFIIIKHNNRHPVLGRVIEVKEDSIRIRVFMGNFVIPSGLYDPSLSYGDCVSYIKKQWLFCAKDD